MEGWIKIKRLLLQAAIEKYMAKEIAD